MSKSKANILIVDDHLHNLDLIIDVLADQGYYVRSATSGQDAIEAIQDDSPDLILLDIEMPGINGYDVCQSVKENPKTEDTPVIFISISDQVLDKVKAFSVGGADYITKPFQIEEMLARIQTHLSIRDLKKELAQRDQELRLEIAKRKEYEQLLKEVTRTDHLTKVHNRRSFFELSEREIERAKKNKLPISVTLIDVDQFKNINDTHGYHIGDQVLFNLAKLCQSKIRDQDILARFGGEEFVILMPNTTVDEAEKTAERLRQVVFESFMATGRINVLITISLGIAGFDVSGEPDLNRLLDNADKALNLSKEAGGNKVTTWEETQSPDDIRSIIDLLN
jgi:diguanylate cyclase (GGDEF)-like protein